MRNSSTRSTSSAGLERHEINVRALTRMPRSIAETGLGEHLLGELVLKQLLDGPSPDLIQLSERLALDPAVLQAVLEQSTRDGHIEQSQEQGGSGRYHLSTRGHAQAREALARSGYRGPAPITLEHYTELVQAHSIHHIRTTRADMHAAYADVEIAPNLLDQLGAAFNSGRPLLVHGPAGSGKTYICQRLANLLGEPVPLPYAIAVGDAVIPVFDPALHQRADAPAQHGDLKSPPQDPRLLLCRRPAIVSGSELTPEMLELGFDPQTRLYRAPLQLLANNGLFLIDDLGRQRYAAASLLNPLTVPMESQRDYHLLEGGQSFTVPFDVSLVFITGMDPAELLDDAFLRRMGHKIRFGYILPQQYTAIWRTACAELEVAFDPKLPRHAIEQLHARFGVPLLSCQPHDLLRTALDQARYAGEASRITPAILDGAWRTCFPTTVNPRVIARNALLSGSPD